MRILYLDDEDFERELLARFAERRGHEVIAVATIGAANIEVGSGEFGAIVLDVHLGNGDCGADIIPMLVKLKYGGQVFVVSGLVDQADIATAEGLARAAGLNLRYVSKTDAHWRQELLARIEDVPS